MSAKQGSTGNKIKRLCVLALLTALCMVIGYLESLVNLSFIAPGIKIGLSNSVACVLIFTGDKKGAFAVNIVRILLSDLLFGSPVSLAFSLAGGLISLTAISLLSRFDSFSIIGISAFGAASHNLAQCAVGIIFVGIGMVYYLPVLLVVGTACGVFVGLLSKLILRRISNKKYV